MEARKARKAEVDKLVDNYFSDSISVSRHVKNLRESATGGAGGASLLVRRVGSRTFYYRLGYFIEAGILDLDEKSIKSRVVRVVAFSKEYMEMITKRRDLTRILALGDRMLFLDGKRIVQIVPAPQPESRPKSPGLPK